MSATIARAAFAATTGYCKNTGSFRWSNFIMVISPSVEGCSLHKGVWCARMYDISNRIPLGLRTVLKIDGYCLTETSEKLNESTCCPWNINLRPLSFLHRIRSLDCNFSVLLLSLALLPVSYSRQQICSVSRWGKEEFLFSSDEVSPFSDMSFCSMALNILDWI